jgi:uncharacterized protein YkwD
VIARRTIAFALLVVLVAAPAALARPDAERQTALQTLELDVLVQLNAVRTSHGLVPLKLNPALDAAARGHTSQMLADGYFAHASADGSPFWKRLTAYTGSAHGAWSAGENLLWSSPDVTGVQALKLWMASPEHRRNILTAKWRDIGISALHANTAPGAYGDRAVTVITTDFGVRG